MVTIPKGITLCRIGGWIMWGGKPMVMCPSCGRRAQLDHVVEEDGTVTPSLVCPHDGCSFHEFVRLEGWDQGRQEHRGG